MESAVGNIVSTIILSSEFFGKRFNFQSGRNHFRKHDVSKKGVSYPLPGVQEMIYILMIFVGYKTYIGYLFLEHTHTNPVIFTFNRLMWETIQNAGDQLSFNADETKELDIEMVHEVVPRRARVRWFLAVTLINNPDLVELRRRDIQEPEIKKDTCIKKFKMKVTQKIDAIKENHAAKHDSKL